MAEPEQPGWAPVADRESGKLETPETGVQPDYSENEELVAFEKDLLLAPLVTNELLSDIRVTLVDILNEMKKANAMATGTMDTYVPIEQPEDIVVPVPEIPSAPEPKAMPKLETEQEIVDYYKGKVLEFKGKDFNEKGLIDEFQFGVEESRVIMTAPWLEGIPFGAWIRHIENEMGGEYIKDARHYVLPKP